MFSSAVCCGLGFSSDFFALCRISFVFWFVGGVVMFSLCGIVVLLVSLCGLGGGFLGFGVWLLAGFLGVVGSCGCFV